MCVVCWPNCSLIDRNNEAHTCTNEIFSILTRGQSSLAHRCIKVFNNKYSDDHKSKELPGFKKIRLSSC